MNSFSLFPPQEANFDELLCITSIRYPRISEDRPFHENQFLLQGPKNIIYLIRIFKHFNESHNLSLYQIILN